MSDTWKCKKCGSTERYPNGHCVPCQKARAKAHAAKNPGVRAAISKRWRENNRERARFLRDEYLRNNPARVLLHAQRSVAKRDGYTPMSLEECERAVSLRKENCEVCGVREATSCDHDHATGKFRGWLCAQCNTAEGMLRTYDNCLRLANYILKHSEVR